MFTIRSLSSRRVSGGLAGAVLVSDGEVFGVLFARDGGRASMAATCAQDLVFSSLSKRLLMLVSCCFWDCATPESEDSRRLMVLSMSVINWLFLATSMILLRALLACLTCLLVISSCLSALRALSASCMMMSGGEISPSKLGGDVALATHNLGTKLMRWASSVVYDLVDVSSLTICQCHKIL